MSLPDHELLAAIQRGDEANELLRQPAFGSAVAEIAQSIVNRWAATDLHEKAKREDLYHQYTALNSIVQELGSRVASGQRNRQVLKDEAEEAAEYGEPDLDPEIAQDLYAEAP